MRKLLLPLLSALAATLVFAAVQGTPKAARQDLPTDQRQRHIEIVTAATHPYTVHLGGNIDGVMTRMPISYSAYKQGWQPNVLARIENVGDTDVINPWLTANGVGDWRTVQKIAQEATRGCTGDADKARAIWEWTRSHRFHACTWDEEVDDAVKAMNVYGYTLCGDDAHVIADLWKAAGLKVRRGYPVGHCVTEAFYDGEFHLLDGDEHVICLRRDNRTIASEAEVVRDHDLLKRTHTYSIGQGDDPLTDQFSASLYGYEGERTGENGGHSTHNMLFTLRPGESLEWRWDHAGKEYSKGADPDPSKPWQDGTGQLKLWGATAYDDLRNGKWVYRVPLDKAVWQKGAVSAENVEDSLTPFPSPMRSQTSAGRGVSRSDGVRVRAADPAKPMKIVWRVASPYVLVGANVQCLYSLGAESDLFRISFSPDGKTWQKIAEGGTAGRNYQPLALDKLLSPSGKPMYQYFIQLEMQGAKCGLSGLTFANDVQMALLAMPELVVGDNALLYTDETTGARQVKITQEWTERSEWHQPTAPVLSYPAAGGSVEGTQVTLKWGAAASPDRDAAIVDYHVQVCERPDMRWVISPNFDKLVSHTPSKVKTEWTVPFAGLLNPDTPYYWRVRALDSRGVWGPWSSPRSFQCRAPGVPLSLKALPDPAKGSVALTWEANPQGRKPVAYKVYGSNEQGFTASDVEYVVKMGRGLCDTMAEYNARTERDPGCGNVKTPPNLVAKTTETRTTLTSPKAFYRVVAVDEQGNESGPSDYVALPRPFIYTMPDIAAKVGQEWRYEPQSILSIGHLTCRDGYSPAFWNREKLTWTLEEGPQWLKLDAGRLSGTAPAAGRYSVVLKVTKSKGQEARQGFVVEVK